MEKFNPCLDLLQQNPYPVYHEYRRLDPVHLGMPPRPEHDESWYLFRYDDVAAVLKNRAFINDRLKAAHALPCSAPLLERKPLWQVFSKWPLFIDPPTHTRIRSRVSKAFTRKAIDILTPLIQETTDQLLDKVINRSDMDLVRDLATPLPVAVISRLLGIRIEDPEQFRTWSKSIADAIDMGISADVYDHAMQLMTEIVSQLRVEFHDKRRQPDDGLVSSLLAAMENDEGIDEDELISLCTMLMFTGQETTIDAISSSVLALLQHPDQQQILRDDPGLVPGAVEELLRYNSPVQMAAIRVAAEDVKVGGKQLRKGDHVMAVLGAANRDPDRFEDPDRLDITRNFGTQDVIFGQGIHICLGIHLARLEVRIVLGTLLRRLKSIQLQSEQLHWRNNVLFRGLTSLPVSFVQ
jgi:cytochrome P450